MLKHRFTNRICCLVLATTILLTVLLMGASALGIVEESRAMGYEARLFDQSRVHTIDIAVDDWEGFLETCTDEEYIDCALVIDGEAYKNVGLRAKGNTSLSSVATYGNDRYSFKIEFDQYKTGGSYYGLDKLSLNNLIQDNTYLKDYLAYTLMNEMGVAAPLCSFVYITVNGEDWGLYLAVEAVEDGFLQRNYGSDYGELYKPDSMSIGGGRGNGRDFDPSQFTNGDEDSESVPGVGDLQMPQGFDSSGRPEMGDMGGMGGGMGGEDTKLQYIDDDPDSYSNIFLNAKTDTSSADQERLIASLKALSEGGDVSSVVDAEAVIRYLVVHNFLCNDDSYTGTMVHNYYLYEEDGVLSMIPWDYNLAFGGFSRGATSGATATVNSPIDSPVSSGEIESRPMVSWIFADEEYTALYHEIYAEFIDAVFTSGWFEEVLDSAVALIAPYVEKDPTAFCTYEEFQTGVNALREFCNLRAQSISGQLSGTIPSTADGQSADGSALIDASAISLSDMGEMGGMGGGGMGKDARGGDAGGEMPDMGGFSDGVRPSMEGLPDAAVAESSAPTEDGQPSVGRDATGAAGADSPWLLLAICAAVLAAGIALAVRYRHHF